MIEFTDLFHLALPFLIVVQPALHHLPLLRPDTELPVPASRISNGENPDLVTFALLTACATLAVENGALDQGTAQELFGDRQGGDDSSALLNSLFLIHLLE